MLSCVKILQRCCLSETKELSMRSLSCTDCCVMVRTASYPEIHARHTNSYNRITSHHIASHLALCTCPPRSHRVQIVAHVGIESPTGRILPRREQYEKPFFLFSLTLLFDGLLSEAAGLLSWNGLDGPVRLGTIAPSVVSIQVHP